MGAGEGISIGTKNEEKLPSFQYRNDEIRKVFLGNLIEKVT